MTALKEYARLEATALWRPAPDAQRVDVIVTLGNATLTVRETLELAADEDEMIRAIEKLRKAVERTRPHSGRLRGVMTLALIGALGFAAYTYLPAAVVDHALRVVPDVKRAEIGNQLLTALQPVTGPPCRAPAGRAPLVSLASRLDQGQAQQSFLAIVRSGVPDAIHLPGGVILLARGLVEDHETPDVVAGYILAEEVRRSDYDPLRRMLEQTGTFATLRLLTSGRMQEAAVDRHAKALLTAQAAPAEPEALLARFQATAVPSTPYAYAIDLSGEQTLALIEGDPARNNAVEPVLSDADWVRLQTICEG